MLQNIRDNAQGTMAKIIIGIMVIPFIFFGVESIFSTSAQKSVAEVNGEEIPEYELLNGIKVQQARLQEQLGEAFDPDMFGEEFLKKSVTESLIQRKLFEQQAQTLGIVASDTAVDKIIVADPTFHENGKFSRNVYEGTLRASGMLPSTYRERLATQITLSQMGGGFQQSGFVTEKELAMLAQITDERRDVVYITVPAITDESTVSVTEEDIQASYEANQSAYMTDEQVSVEYLVLNMQDFFEPVSDEDLQARYNEEKAAFEGEAEWQVAHIMVEINDDRDADAASAEAEKISARLQNGEEFAALARELSDDAGTAETGGELGLLKLGDFPEFDNALQALQTGDVSAPVQSESGVHLLKVIDKKQQSFESFADAKARLQRDIQITRATPDYVSNVDLLKDISFGAADLSGIAAEFGKDVEATELFARSGARGVFTNADILRKVFSADFRSADVVSDVIELNDEQAIVMKLKQHQAPQAIPLADVAEAVRESLVRQKLDEATEARGKRVLEALSAGQSAEEIAKAEALEWQAENGVRRSSIKLARDIVAAAFNANMAAGSKAYTEARLGDGSRAVIQVSNARDGELRSLNAQEREQLAASFAAAKGQQDFEQYFAAVRSQSDVEIFD
jgi:peptidyl-prolyl cis-trans isomerase D